MSDTRNDEEGTPKSDGLGDEGTIPNSDDGLAVGVGGDSNFNQEEDEEAGTDA